MTMPASPVNTSVSASRRAAMPVDPVSRTTRVAVSAPPSRPAWPSGPSMALIER